MRYLSFASLLLLGVTLPGPSSAQFFKKLKTAVNNTVNSVSAGMVTDAGSGGNSGGSVYTVKPTHTDISVYHPAAIYSLQPGEKFDFTETCLLLDAAMNATQIIISKGNARYVVRQGGRLEKVTYTNISGCAFNGETGAYNRYKNLSGMEDDASESPMSSDNDLNQYIKISATAANGPGTYIDCNNKSYGPYGMVTSLIFNKPKDQFKAVVSINDDEDTGGNVHLRLIGSGGEKTDLPFTNSCYILNGSYDRPLLLGVSMDDVMHPVLYDPQTRQSIRLIHDPDMIQVDKRTGALVYADKGKVYIDGKLAKTFPANVQTMPQHVYTGRDHSHWAVWTSAGLYFYNNTMIDGVLSCKVQMRDGKETLSWIVLGKDNKTLYLCHEIL